MEEQGVSNLSPSGPQWLKLLPANRNGLQVTCLGFQVSLNYQVADTVKTLKDCSFPTPVS